MKKPELLAPAGSLEKLKIACLYGADAVYVGGEAYSLRTAAENFSLEDFKKGLDFAHNLGKKVYITANIIPHNKDIDAFESFLKEIAPLGFDGIIVADLGMMSVVKSLAPNIPIHISTQANNVNYATVNMWHSLGAKRVVLARELSLSEVKEIREKTPPELELEMFIHGAMCISYSGRCLLSNYMAHRDANLGACAQPCRWNYNLVEEKRPNEFMNVYENERGTFIFNSKDLCMIENIKELIEAGATSFKIEGRVKTEYYVATVVKAYRGEIDSYFENPKKYVLNQKNLDEVRKVSHRPYSTGFCFDKPTENSQVYTDSSYIRTYDVVGIVTDYDHITGIATINQRNKFNVGDEIEIMQPKGEFFTQIVNNMTDGNGEQITSAPHAAMVIKLKTDKPVVVNSFLRKFTGNEYYK